MSNQSVFLGLLFMLQFDFFILFFFLIRAMNIIGKQLDDIYDLTLSRSRG